MYRSPKKGMCASFTSHLHIAYDVYCCTLNAKDRDWEHKPVRSMVKPMKGEETRSPNVGLWNTLMQKLYSQ